MGTGARALRTLVENLLADTTFEVASMDGHKVVTVTRDAVEGKCTPKIEVLALGAC